MAARPRGRPLSDAEVDRARALYDELGSCARVASHFGVSVNALKHKLGLISSCQRSGRARRRAEPSCPPKESGRALAAKNALYDPLRDGAPALSPAQELLGDPPPGRRELLEANAARTAPYEVHPNYRYWRL